MLISLERGMGALNAQDPLAHKVREAEARLSKPLSYQATFNELHQAWTLSTKFLNTAKTMRNLEPGRLAEIERATLNLLELRSLYRLRAQKTPQKVEVPPAEVRAAVAAPVRWLSAVAKRELKASNARAETVKKLARGAANAPGKGLDWLLSNLAKGLGVPQWVLPAAGGLLVLGVVAYAANTAKGLIPRSQQP